MATAGPAKRLKNELSCSLCHEYFTEPVNIECGHSFCQDCIIRFWGEQEQETVFSCPQCGEKAATRELRPNKELGIVAATAKQMKSEPLESVGEKMCEVHQKPLELFCKEEGKLLCPSCAESEEHATHSLLTEEEAAEDYKQKLQINLQGLIEERKKALDFQITDEKRKEEFLEKVGGEKQKIVSKFEELQRFLEEQKKAILDQLDELLKKSEKVTTKVSCEIHVVDTLIHEVEEKCKQPASVFFQDVGETLSRCAWEFQQSPNVSSELDKQLCLLSKSYLIKHVTMEEFKETFSPDEEAVKWAVPFRI